ELVVPQRLLGYLLVGRIPADGLIFGDDPVRIEDGAIAPPLPSDLAVGHDDPVLDRPDGAGRSERREVSLYRCPVFAGYARHEPLPDDLLPSPPEVSAVGLVDE